jgi:hypothetical protein
VTPGLTIVDAGGGIGPLITAGFEAASRGRQAHLFVIEEPDNVGGSYDGIPSTSYARLGDGILAIRDTILDSRPGDAVLLDMTSFDVSPIELDDLGELARRRGVALVVAMDVAP